MNTLGKQAEEKANKLIHQAEKKLQSWFGSNKKEEAMELYKDAATQLKIAQNWSRAGDCFIKAAELSIQIGDSMDAATRFHDAASCFNKGDQINEAISMYNQAIPLHIEAGRLNMAAKIYKELAEIQESDGDEKSALSNYLDAAQCYATEDRNSNANECLIKAAEIQAKNKEYIAAISLYEKIATVSASNNLLKYKCPEYFFKCLLCRWADNILNHHEISSLQDNLQNYVNIYPAFVSSREYKFIQGILEAFINGEVEKFTEVCFEFDRLTPLDSWKTSVLLDIKKELQTPSAPDFT